MHVDKLLTKCMQIFSSLYFRFHDKPLIVPHLLPRLTYRLLYSPRNFMANNNCLNYNHLVYAEVPSIGEIENQTFSIQPRAFDSTIINLQCYISDQLVNVAGDTSDAMRCRMPVAETDARIIIHCKTNKQPQDVGEKISRKIIRMLYIFFIFFIKMLNKRPKYQLF